MNDNIIRFLKVEDIKNNKVRKIFNKYDKDKRLYGKDYDLKITLTTQGRTKTPCLKFLFSNCEMIKNLIEEQGGFEKIGNKVPGYLSIYHIPYIEELKRYLFLSVSFEFETHSRALSCETSARISETAEYVSLGAKIACEPKGFKLLTEFEGKYKLHSTDVDTDLYYIDLHEKLGDEV